MESSSLQYSTQCTKCKVYNVPQTLICFVCGNKIRLDSKSNKLMMRPFLNLILLSAIVLTPVSADKIAAAQAKEHIGKTKTVCGLVASTRYAEKSKGQPTFLNLDKPFPTAIFTVVIWGEDRAKFGEPEKTLANKRICVTGQITEFRGRPEIEAKEKKQITIESTE